MSTGRLYSCNDEQFLTEITYRMQSDSPANWWGELTMVQNSPLVVDGGRYVIELDDRRRGTCYLKKKINRAVSGFPTRYIYHFSGNGLLEK